MGKAFDFGIEGQPCIVEIDDKFTGHNGICLKARFWYSTDGVNLNPGKNGIFVPVSFGYEFINTLIDKMNQYTGQHMALVDMGDESGS
jgi:hypothetical protein